jgi:hypothetical protein
MIQFTTLWFVYSESTRSKNLILNMCSHEDHMHRNYLQQHTFNRVTYTSVPLKITHIPYAETVACSLNTLYLFAQLPIYLFTYFFTFNLLLCIFIHLRILSL